jgi:phosphoglycerate dehydrogenase-like enzyme
MRTDSLFVLVGFPKPMRAVFGEANLDRMRQAHPRVRVEIVDSPERFGELLPEADGVFIGAFPISAAALQPGSRLRWVQSLAAGVNGQLTPELIAAEHIVMTSSKGPLGPAMAEHCALLMLALRRGGHGPTVR